MKISKNPGACPEFGEAAEVGIQAFGEKYDDLINLCGAIFGQVPGLTNDHRRRYEETGMPEKPE